MFVRTVPIKHELSTVPSITTLQLSIPLNLTVLTPYINRTASALLFLAYFASHTVFKA